MKILTSIALIVGLATPSLAEEETSTARKVTALEELLALCEASGKCGDIITKATYRINGEEVTGVEVSLPSGKVFYFKKIDPRSLISGGCYCGDCVSSTPLVWCEVL